MKLFTHAIGMAIYPTIYIRDDYVNHPDRWWLLKHEKTHWLEQKNMGVFKWIWKYKTEPRFNYWAEIRAYAVAISNGLEMKRAIKWVDKYHNKIGKTENQILADLTGEYRKLVIAR